MILLKYVSTWSIWVLLYAQKHHLKNLLKMCTRWTSVHMAGQSRVHIYVTAHDFGDHGKFSRIKTIGCLFKQCIGLLLECHLQYFHNANRMEKNQQIT